MAPFAGKQSSRLESTTTRPTSSSTNSVARSGTTGGLFRTTKEDKRRIKHSTFMSRIEKPTVKSHKRRRPTKKLVTTLESLAGALPEILPHVLPSSTTNNARIIQKSLKSKPGALKMKAKVEELERQRFNQNLAQMTGGDTQAREPNTAPRWAALREFIASTMEQKI